MGALGAGGPIKTTLPHEKLILMSMHVNYNRADFITGRVELSDQYVSNQTLYISAKYMYWKFSFVVCVCVCVCVVLQSAQAIPLFMRSKQSLLDISQNSPCKLQCKDSV